ncbi:hypothetical protein F5I97DRAFT_1873808, partial [Phlebopus sp. FC_14]
MLVLCAFLFNIPAVGSIYFLLDLSRQAVREALWQRVARNRTPAFPGNMIGKLYASFHTLSRQSEVGDGIICPVPCG